MLEYSGLTQGIFMQPLSHELQQRAASIKLLILDVDGVLTDGHIYIRDRFTLSMVMA